MTISCKLRPRIFRYPGTRCHHVPG